MLTHTSPRTIKQIKVVKWDLDWSDRLAMKTFMLSIIAVLTTGCASVYLEGRDIEKGTVSLTAQRFASDEKMLAEAGRHCGGSAKLIRTEKYRSGSSSYTDSYGYTHTTANGGTIFTYRCSQTSSK